ncbi:unnamed protein product, partial [Lampetra planeri]
RPGGVVVEVVVVGEHEVRLSSTRRGMGERAARKRKCCGSSSNSSSSNGGGLGGLGCLGLSGLGDLSTASHGCRDLRFRDRSFSETGDRATALGLGLAASSQTQSSNSSRYKTELCRPFQESGTCKYGDKCQFAHGHHELRGLVRHPKYKTELCRTFHTIGFCPYGPRCHFIHNAEENRLAAAAAAAAAAGGSGSHGSGSHGSHSMAQRPRLSHSVSFAGFPSGGVAGGGRRCARSDSPPTLLESPASLTPPPGLLFASVSEEAILQQLSPLPAGTKNPFVFSNHRGVPTMMGNGGSGVARSQSPLDSLSDPDAGYLSSGGSSGCESPGPDGSGKRLPIFSRLSISED